VVLMLDRVPFIEGPALCCELEFYLTAHFISFLSFIPVDSKLDEYFHLFYKVYRNSVIEILNSHHNLYSLLI